QTLVSREGRLRYSWGPSGHFDSQVEDYVLQAVEQTRRSYHVHSERIYLAGVCEGAGLAYRLRPLYPGPVAGVNALHGLMPRQARPLFRLPELRQLRVFMGHGIANSYAPLSLARQDERLLYTAGLSVKLTTYPTNHRLHPDMLRDINRWIIDLCN